MKVEIQISAGRFKQARTAGLVNEGDEITVEYDSNYGGTQTVTGAVEYNQEIAASDYPVVDGREIHGIHVRSEKDGRDLGMAKNVTLRVEKGRAVEISTLHMNGQDVDDPGAEKPGEKIYVQSWDGDYRRDDTLTVV